jgi:tetratricopeptide (TPR) repeat protein
MAKSGNVSPGYSIVFLPVPESLQSKIDIEDFSFNPSIPIPVEISAGSETGALENLTIEMIIAGMIRVICQYAAANRADDEVSVYYRNFVLAFKPNIMAEFKSAAMVHLRNGSYGMAREIITALAGLFPGSGEASELGSMLARETDPETGSGSEPDYREAYHLIRDGNEEAGMEKLRRFLEHRPDSWNGWFMLGWALRRLKRWEDALACFRKALETGGRCADTYNEIAICLMETGRWEAARGELETALAGDGKNIKILSNLAILALKTGNETEADALFRKVLEIEPDDPLAKFFFRE